MRNQREIIVRRRRSKWLAFESIHLAYTCILILVVVVLDIVQLRKHCCRCCCCCRFGKVSELFRHQTLFYTSVVICCSCSYCSYETTTTTTTCSLLLKRVGQIMLSLGSNRAAHARKITISVCLCCAICCLILDSLSLSHHYADN